MGHFVVDKRARPLLDFIPEIEVGIATKQQNVSSAYDVVSGYIDAADRPQNLLGAHLTKLTVKQVLDWQDSIDPKYQSEAAGAFQIMEDTLRGLVSAGSINANMLFDAPGQDACCFVLLKYRGWDKFISGNMSAEAYADNLAREWASFPVHSTQKGRHRTVNRGQSYYAGDGLNKAYATPTQVMDALRQTLNAPDEPTLEAIVQQQQIQIDRLQAQIAAVHTATAQTGR